MRLDATEFKKVRDEFRELLDEHHLEQIYQRSMEQQTVLIPREFVQNHGIHFGLVFRKISLAKDYAPGSSICQRVRLTGTWYW